MSRSSQNCVGPFVRASDNLNSSLQFWNYIKFVSSVQLHGPFCVRMKIYKMRSHLEFAATQEDSYFEAICFESVAAYNRFDQVFGKYCRYGNVSLTKPSADETVATDEDHMVSTLGQGLPSCPAHY